MCAHRKSKCCVKAAFGKTTRAVEAKRDIVSETVEEALITKKR
jgi:hypothetical protein